MTFETSFIANREVRFIPAGWQHPKDERGRYVPLLPLAIARRTASREEDRNGVGEMPDTRRPEPERAGDRRLRDDDGGHANHARLPEHAGRQAGGGELVRRARHDFERLQGRRGSLGGDAVHGPCRPGRWPTTAASASPEPEQRGLRPADAPAFLVVSGDTMSESCAPDRLLI